MKSILEQFDTINVYSEQGRHSLHKPVLLLYALAQCHQKKDRLLSFFSIDKAFKDLFLKLSFDGKYENSHYPFGKLENDGIWEVIDSKILKRTSVGHLSKSELFIKNIHGGFTKEIYQALLSDKNLLLTSTTQLLNRYFPQEQHKLLRSALGLPELDNVATSMTVSDLSAVYKNNVFSDTSNTGEKIMATKQNGYIAYLNSLHNVNASGANALAESQALNHYFTELYQPFPIIDVLYKTLLETQDRVILLTGHAGDGKSTVALDVLKRLRNHPFDKPLDNALNEREEAGRVTIVKDMSELSAERRLTWLKQSFTESGSWLIVSNTGPLINSLAEFADDIESKILELLDKPYEQGNLASHSLRLPNFSKELIIINMTRLDNVAIGARVLTRMVNHSAWMQCSGCEAENCCSLRLNRAALQEVIATVEERVRWIYQRITAYEQRLTLRQMVAHIALSLTGGMSCEEAKQSVNTTQGVDGLERILFSEGFFGYRRGESWSAAENLRAIALVKRAVFGAPTAVDFERQLLVTGGVDGLDLPKVLTQVQQRWRERSTEAAGVRWRFALRRMLYLFGKQSPNNSQGQTDTFLNTFLQSPKLRGFDNWQSGELKLDDTEKRVLKKRCLQVLLEIYSGFSSGQFQDHDCLYLTLRRSDISVIQPTQLVVAKLSNEDFSLAYDVERRLPKLIYQNGKGKVELLLTLPLLDYIHNRSIGSLGNGLAPIHLAQLEWFRAELLKIASHYASNIVGLLRSGIDGKVVLRRYVVNEQQQRLEQDL